ncbi:MAG: type VI secretion system-associated FHA domain protein TagH [Nitrosospira sp.]
MIICIRVTSYNGAPPAQPLFAEFNELGGKIGRAEGNALVLHDPMRVISRTHASVEFRNGRYFVRNLGTAIPVYVNGQPLGNGRDAAVAPGDEIRIGGYTMNVEKSDKPASVSGSSILSALPKDDPLALFGGQAGINPFDDPLTPFPGSQPPNASSLKAKERYARPPCDPHATQAATTPSGTIPPDFDPFAEMVPPVPQQPLSPPHAPAADDILGLGFGFSASNQSINDLFGLNADGGSDPFAPGTPLAPPMNGPDTASVDPLVAMGDVPAKKPSHGLAQRDDVPSLHESFRLPEPKLDTVMRAVLPAASHSGSDDVSSFEPYGMVLSWENKVSAQDTEIKSVIVPSPKPERRMAGRRLADQGKVVPGNVIAAATDGAPIAERAEVPVDVSPDRNTAGHDELLRAFLAGAGVPDIVTRMELNPQFMHVLGQLLRESTQGTLDLLLARTLTKREVRADLTIIAPRENNPLKFSPSAEVALAHLLAPQGRGFMTPLQAMKDAHTDLRSHQFGFMAGMRAALAGVLKRFQPEELERRLTQKSMIDAILPSKRKARLWDMFAEHYKDISHEAEEDFHALFGKEFLRAYEAQIARLEQDDRNMKN